MKSTLAYGYLGNGVTIWHRDSTEHGFAHINEDRTVTYCFGFVPTEDERYDIEDFAKQHNFIYRQGNETTGGSLVLRPINKPTRIVFSEYMSEFYPLTVENVGGKQVLCFGRQIWDRDPEDFDTIEQAEDKLQDAFLNARTEWQYFPNEEKRIAMLVAEKKYNQFKSLLKSYGIHQ